MNLSLRTGTTFAVLSTEGKTLIASKLHFLEEIMFYKVYYLGILFRYMMLAISSLSVGCRNIVLLVLFESEKCLCGYFMFFFIVSAIEAK